ncbi:MAG: hydroxymethylglutaryl-CoA reductase [Pseudomonadota bacterium]
MISFQVAELLRTIRARFDIDTLRRRLAPDTAPVRSLRPTRGASAAHANRYWDQLIAQGPASDADRDAIADPVSLADAEIYGGNIENFAGTVKLPVGIVGPLRVRGVNASGDYHIPLATTEAALVASYGRGVQVATRAGGVQAAVLYEGVIRTPAFRFADLLHSGMFVDWIAGQTDTLASVAEGTTRHGKLLAIDPVIDNDTVFLICRYSTGDASGQNMVTIATEALCRHVADTCPIPIACWYIEGNFSGDKKASALGLVTGRGRKVSASVTLPGDLVRSHLGTSVEDMLAYGRVANLGSLLSGQMGAQAHYANGLAALYIATGQDAACVAESAMGFTRMEARGDDLFCAVTMPNILVGSVGGGTGLPSQSAALRMMGLHGAGHGRALAEITAALCLCGEISIVAAIAAGHFTRAHEKLARHR